MDTSEDVAIARRSSAGQKRKPKQTRRMKHIWSSVNPKKKYSGILTVLLASRVRLSSVSFDSIDVQSSYFGGTALPQFTPLRQYNMIILNPSRRESAGHDH